MNLFKWIHKMNLLKYAAVFPLHRWEILQKPFHQTRREKAKIWTQTLWFLTPCSFCCTIHKNNPWRHDIRVKFPSFIDWKIDTSHVLWKVTGRIYLQSETGVLESLSVCFPHLKLTQKRLKETNNELNNIK